MRCDQRDAGGNHMPAALPPRSFMRFTVPSPSCLQVDSQDSGLLERAWSVSVMADSV